MKQNSHKFMDPTSMRSSFPGADLGDTFSSHLICCWMHDVIVSMILVGDAMLVSGCSWEHPELKKKIYIYIIIKIFYLFILKKKN